MCFQTADTTQLSAELGMFCAHIGSGQYGRVVSQDSSVDCEISIRCNSQGAASDGSSLMEDCSFYTYGITGY